MEIFSQNELMLMIGVVSVLLFCIIVLTIFDIREYLKNKHNNLVLEEEEKKISPLEVEEEQKESIEVYEEQPEEVLVSDIKEEVLEPIVQKDNNEVETLIMDHNDQESVAEPLETVEIVPVKKEENLSVQVNEVKENIDLQEEINKAVNVPSLEDTITNFEMEQERTAIISLDELLERSNELYDANEVVQYDDGDEPITIDEVMHRFNTEQVVTKEMPEVVEKVIEEPKKVLYSHKETTPFISSIYGLEPDDKALAFENTATYEKLDRQKNSDFMNKLREMSENKLNH